MTRAVIQRPKLTRRRPFVDKRSARGVAFYGRRVGGSIIFADVRDSRIELHFGLNDGYIPLLKPVGTCPIMLNDREIGIGERFVYYPDNGVQMR